MAEMGGVTMGAEPVLFLALWVVMMVAMMFPTAAPMILTFAQVQAGRRERGAAFVPTWVFVGSYLLVWTMFGVVAYALARAAEMAADSSPALAEHAPRLGGAAIALAGLYQVSPLKTACLSKCRSPLNWLMASWREERGGAIRMGLEHGLYCLGCCWLLFVILFPLGMMNITAMALITVLIFAEKTLPVGRGIAQIAAVILIVYGLAVVVEPGLLPTTTAGMQSAPEMEGTPNGM